MGSGGGDVFVDETYFGRDPDRPFSRMAWRHINQIFDAGRSHNRSLDLDGVRRNDHRRQHHAGSRKLTSPKDARLLTDDARHYRIPGKGFADHGYVAHTRGEYVSRDDPSITTNQIEGFFGIFKRGCAAFISIAAKQHLHRYLAEFDFRYTNREATGCNDTERA